MVSIPAGKFWMGCNSCEGSAVNDELCHAPEHGYHDVVLDEYEIDVTEVTVGQYELCVSDNGHCQGRSLFDNQCNTPDKTSHPVNCVTWTQADTYCKWAGKHLCTEAQWEKAARGGCQQYQALGLDCENHARKYPWADGFPVSCNAEEKVAAYSGCKCGTGTCEVGTHDLGKSLYGLSDLGGNVWEWVADWFGSDYYCKGADADTTSMTTYCDNCAAGDDGVKSNPLGPQTGTDRVARGGSFNGSSTELRVSMRSHAPPTEKFADVGFRCCR